MNIFRFVADMLHLLSIFILLYKIMKEKSVSGLSLKTQQAYAIVFCCRYLDLFFRFYSLYNTSMKIIFILTTIYTCYLISKKYANTYDKTNDIVKLIYLIVPCLIVTVFLTKSYYPRRFLWTFSLWLEAVAIFPQLVVIRRYGKSEVLTSHYMAALGAYRAFYIFNWIYRYIQTRYFYPNAFFAGIVQTLMYIQFLYLYMTKILAGRRVDLPGSAYQ